MILQRCNAKAGGCGYPLVKLHRGGPALCWDQQKAGTLRCRRCNLAFVPAGPVLKAGRITVYIVENPAGLYEAWSTHPAAAGRVDGFGETEGAAVTAFVCRLRAVVGLVNAGFYSFVREDGSALDA